MYVIKHSLKHLFSKVCIILNCVEVVVRIPSNALMKTCFVYFELGR